MGVTWSLLTAVNTVLVGASQVAASDQAENSQPQWLSEHVLSMHIGNKTFNSQLVEMSRQLMLSHEGLARSNRGGWHSPYLETSTAPALVELQRRLEDPALAFLDRFTGGSTLVRSRSMRLRVASLWVNVHHPSDSNVPHRHAELDADGEDVPVISGVYYAAEGSQGTSAKLRFENATKAGDSLSVDPSPGKAVLFPATCLHEVVPASFVDAHAASRLDDVSARQDDASARISLSFNLVVRWLSAPLEKSASAGSLAEVTELLQQGAAVNAAGHHSLTALHHAAEMGHVKMVNHLVMNSASVGMISRGGQQPIHLAAATGHTPVVQSLISHRANIDASWASGGTPIHLAAANGDLPLLEYLHASGANLHSTDQFGGLALHAAIRNGHVDVAEALLRRGMSPDAADDADGRPIHEAIRGGHLKMATLLLTSRADLELADKQGRGPAMWAALAGHTQLLQWLADVGKYVADGSAAAPDEAEDGAPPGSARSKAMADYLAAAMVGQGGGFQVKPAECTPLHLAAEEGHTAAAEWLLWRGHADPRAAAVGSRAEPIHLAAKEGYNDMIELLLEARSNPIARARGHLQALHLAALQGHLRSVDLLLARRARASCSASDGGQPMHLAAAQGHFPVVSRLLAARASVNVATRTGQQPLHRVAASAEGHLQIVDLLIANRAEISRKDRDGLVPADLASASGHRHPVHTQLSITNSERLRDSE